MGHPWFTHANAFALSKLQWKNNVCSMPKIRTAQKAHCHNCSRFPGFGTSLPSRLTKPPHRGYLYLCVCVCANELLLIHTKIMQVVDSQLWFYYLLVVDPTGVEAECRALNLHLSASLILESTFDVTTACVHIRVYSIITEWGKRERWLGCCSFCVIIELEMHGKLFAQLPTSAWILHNSFQLFNNPRTV